MKPTLKTLIVIGPLLCALAAAAGRHDYWTVLSRHEAEKMKQPCSRPFPDGLGGWWEPSEAEVERAEKKLPAAIDAAFARLWQTDRRRRPDRYYRQYAGFRRNAKRVVYVNAVGSFTSETPEALFGEWRTTIVNSCDGGTYAFGAVYDLDKDTFDSFFFSGRFEGPVPGGGW